MYNSVDLRRNLKLQRVVQTQGRVPGIPGSVKVFTVSCDGGVSTVYGDVQSVSVNTLMEFLPSLEFVNSPFCVQLFYFSFCQS